MLSILIPTYNYSIVDLVKTIWKQCKEEALQFEILVVDDCSTDIKIKEQNNAINELDACRLIENPQNLGRTASRNLLAQKAAFNWLLFLDADVIPVNENFIKNFKLQNNKAHKVIYGGVRYLDTLPKKENMLRWKYGKKREAKSVAQRLKEPYFIISQNLLIQKTVFFDTNTIQKNNYGLDILFSNNLKKNNITVKHIDNPVYHLGLETSEVFIEKSLESVKTTVNLENEHLLSSDLRPLQKNYLYLKKWKLTRLFSWFITILKKQIRKILLSKNPSLFLFDLYRLQYYVSLKSKSNA